MNQLLNNLRPVKHTLSEWSKFWEQRQFAFREQKIKDTQHAPINIRKIFHTGPYFAMVLNYETMEYEYVNGVEQVLGFRTTVIYEGKYPFLAQLVHPDDQEKLFGLAIFYQTFVDSQPIEKRLDFKGSINFRIRKADGTYIKVLEEVISLKTDQNGKITHALKYFTEITRLNYADEVVLVLVDDKDEENQKFYTFNLEDKSVPNVSNTAFTKRELEILSLASQGLSSKEMADKLQLSQFTINKHRENMMRKTGSRNMNEVLSFAFCNKYI